MSARAIRTPAVAFCAAISALTGAASAQTGLVQGATVIASTGSAVPDANGVAIPGATFDGAPNFFSNPSISENGGVLFRGTIGGAAPGTEIGWFYGSSPTNVALVLRAGDPVPGLAGPTIGDGTTTGLLSPTILSPDGRVLLSAKISGTGVTSTNDTVLLTGFPGALATLAREGDFIPNTTGATFGTLSTQLVSSAINRNGHVYFKNTMAGVVGIGNDEAWFAGPPGALEMFARENSVVQGAPIEVLGTGSCQMSSADEVIVQVSLSTSSGSPPATSADDAVLLMHSPTLGTQVVLREGQSAPGTSGGLLFGLPNCGQNSFTSTGKIAFTSAISGGDVVGTTNDTAIFTGAFGSLSLAVRENDPAPGTTGAVISVFNPAGLRHTEDDTIFFSCQLRGGDTVAGANDDGIFLWTPSGLRLVARRGQLAPGGQGSVFGPLQLGPYLRNGNGQIVFANTLAAGPGGLVGKSWWSYDSVSGALTPVWLPGETFTVGATTETITDLLPFGPNNNTESGSLPFGNDGKLAAQLVFASGNRAIVVLDVTNASGSPYCFGDGSGTACPCGNAGIAGNGCANSVFADGATLRASGARSLSSDTLVLHGSGMPNSSALYFQGTTQSAAGFGTVFGDGLRCSSGTVIRLKTVANASNASLYPGVGDPSISVRGMIAAPGTRTYQVWYRNAAAFCTASTFNLSNGVQVDWIP